jgi:tRNA A22 N-methylase
MARQGLTISHELLIKETRRYYVIIHSHYTGQVFDLSPLEADIGPLILRQKDALAREYQTYWLRKYKRVVEEAGYAHKGLRINLDEYKNKIAALEGLLNAGQS